MYIQAAFGVFYRWSTFVLSRVKDKHVKLLWQCLLVPFDYIDLRKAYFFKQIIKFLNFDLWLLALVTFKKKIMFLYSINKIKLV